MWMIYVIVGFCLVSVFNFVRQFINAKRVRINELERKLECAEANRDRLEKLRKQDKEQNEKRCILEGVR